MQFPQKIPKVVILFAILSSVIACSVETNPNEGGCLKDDDCRYGRVCRDRICLDEGELATYESASDVAQQIFESFRNSDFDAYVQVVPTPRDLTWGFDIGEVDYTEPRVNGYIDSRYDKLETDWIDASRSIDWENAEWQAFEPGVLRPISEGENLALAALDQLVGSEILLVVNGEEVVFPLARLIRLQGYWRVFALVEPPYSVGVDLL